MNQLEPPIRSPSQTAESEVDELDDQAGNSPKRLKTSPTTAAGKRGRPRKEDDMAAPKSSSSAPTLREGQKRKEQNRAAQRAFRERKEKHVKELESHNAALTATVGGLSSENLSLKDLLARLQKENVQLKRTALTCTCSSSRPLTNTSSMMSSVRSSNFHKIGAPDGFLA
ncbi:hypothetical protein BDY24DRAFT_416127 [Mrakia frigida]|uniref:bZIP transcription factor n=1 Tax=Mrakia frigida TaxID=29902 RepID=UPI003FCBF8FE